MALQSAQARGGRGSQPGMRLVGNRLLYAVSIFASLGVFLFGYDQGVMSGIITGPHFIKYFDRPGPLQVGSMVAVLEVGAFATSLAAGRVGDIIGRKGTLFIGALVFTFGGAIQTFTTGFSIMVLGRIVSGAGVGLLSTIVPIYQSEISPPNHRGALAAAEFTGNVFGYSVSVWTDYFCSFIDSDYSWRIPLFIQCVIGALLAVGSLIMPESPRWLIDNDKDDEGLRVIADLHGGDLDDPIARAEYREIKDKVISERESGAARTYGTMWRRYKQRVLLAMSSQAFAQLNGINVISYYAPKVFEEAGWLGRQAILMTGINSVVYVLSTLPPWYLVDRWGRRPILLSGATVMALSLFATGYFMYLDHPETPNAVVICVIIFNAAFGYSWGPIPWLYPPEIMPLTVRAKGVSLSTATNWAFNFLVGEITPYLQEVITWRLYIMHGLFCCASFILVYFVYPETKGVSLEDMDAVFGEGNGKSSLALNTITERSSFLPPSSSSLYPPNRSRIQSSNTDGLLGRLFNRNNSRRDASEYQALNVDEEEVTMSRLDEGRVGSPIVGGDDEEDVGEYEVVERHMTRASR
ncbi:hypothetical protein BDP27DRAFT_1330538 [Rhodocollybia butyracea]|uniref:Major facilitator superfamily (MFS) profile domain-containing protein n=1 Tax=Rhodocollybia butyracea TaxID=206335 RepID=A0A9P5U646_9AGAR|nr:hypothetical protein BDP27DRAFT_1330538 [Rhodocollybia butyracea]